MKILSVSEAKMKLSGIVESIRSSDQEVVITKNGAPAAVLISPDEYERLKETSAILADASLLSEIKKGLNELKRKKARLYTLDELFG